MSSESFGSAEHYDDDHEESSEAADGEEADEDDAGGIQVLAEFGGLTGLIVRLSETKWKSLGTQIHFSPQFGSNIPKLCLLQINQWYNTGGIRIDDYFYCFALSWKLK